MIHVRLTYMLLKKLEFVLVIFLKEIAKYADTCTAAQVDLSLSVGLWVAGTFKLYEIMCHYLH